LTRATVSTEQPHGRSRLPLGEQAAVVLWINSDDPHTRTVNELRGVVG